MAKETTTVFKITVRHKGPHKVFGKIFLGDVTKHAIEWKMEELQSTTKDLGTVNPGFKIVESIKIIRLFVKDICEKIGLNWCPGGPIEPGYYRLAYSYAIFGLSGVITATLNGGKVWINVLSDHNKLEIWVNQEPFPSDELDEASTYNWNNLLIGDPRLGAFLTELFETIINRGDLKYVRPKESIGDKSQD